MDEPHQSELQVQIIDIVATAADVGAERVGLDDDFFDTLGMDSLALTFLYVELGVRFRIQEDILRQASETVRTSRQLLDLLRTQLPSDD